MMDKDIVESILACCCLILASAVFLFIIIGGYKYCKHDEYRKERYAYLITRERLSDSENIELATINYELIK